MIARDKESSTGIVVNCDKIDNSVMDIFSQHFKSKNNIWMVLGNRGTTNYYRERFFLKNWIFWDEHLDCGNVGISGDFSKPKNWEKISKLLSEKVSYIAVDFNELVNHPDRNEIIRASKNILKSSGVFCIEDVYDNQKKRFKHFTQEDFQELSEDFYIKYAYWDGYISALPYTSNQSLNSRSDIYRGLETMILRLGSANAEEKRKLLPYITDELYKKTFSIEVPLIERLIRDVVNTSYLNQMIRNYEQVTSTYEQIKSSIEKEQKLVTELKEDINKYQKLSGVVVTSSKFASFAKDLETITIGDTANAKPNSSFVKKISNFLSERKEDVKNLDERIQNKKEDLSLHERNIEALKLQLSLAEQNVKNANDKILKYNEAVFSKFERDEYLRRYVLYKRTKLEDIIEDNKKSNDEFWSDYNNFGNSISKTEILAKELEKSWSPDVLIQNVVPIDFIKSSSDNKISNVDRIIILFIKK